MRGAGAGAAAAGLLGAQPASASGDRGRPDPYDLTATVPAPRGRWSPDPQGPRFTVVVMPDTQYLFDQDRIHPVPVEASFRYVLDPAGRAGGPDENVVFLAHLGDVTNNGLAEEFAAATKVFDLLDNAGAAYGVLAGNHDVSADDQRGDTPYLDTFGPARARKSPGYHSSSPDGYNTGHVFRAGGRAPVNTLTFDRGYTFEVFFKVPADWDPGRNGWSAMLSRRGTAAQAGKSGPSATADEPVLTLGLSSSIELQWNAYPLNQDGATTNWSHLLQQDEWWHVAVVNDGRVSRLYVNGCEEGRNPSTPAIGLSTLNLPFLLGGYEWAGEISQVFHGTIGDVRITDRPLQPAQFMIA